MKLKTTDRVIDYALCFLLANWDDNVEDDLGITYDNFAKIIDKWQKEVPVQWGNPNEETK
jgi:hypothetical protein